MEEDECQKIIKEFFDVFDQIETTDNDREVRVFTITSIRCLETPKLHTAMENLRNLIKGEINE